MTSDLAVNSELPTRDERRQSPRQRVFKGGTISFNKGYGALECVVRNLSQGGAKLTFGDMLAVPGEFGLSIGGSKARGATVCWRHGVNVGVSFRDG